ncbi:hypothetical protein ACJ72_03812 [Emergomyces africanus]|uniref:Fido domain-containing protein n=1 Tax=Emergomyces africanus TaxID=1955775 RepID=A0A1B7NZ22_9EURO|nr:hypothetical protein ACJ72_03812 [Emergomyces africanus]
MATSVATKKFRFLTAEQVIRLYKTSIANVGPTQPAMLESAVASPMNVKHYAQQENIFQLAANLSEKIMKNHAFMDGNKRAALLAADMFLSVNGYKLQDIPMAHDSVNQGIANAHVAVTTNQWTGEQLGNYYESVATPIASWTQDILAWRDYIIEY